ncbi:hypothetical protein [Flavobacterium sp. UBA6135]|uniref:hypothetical protein n=1 Tax=Flavobacterium sp. UBA6135 TaxID=1946553 RepID=UPI0025C54AA2|nr:hypothetical protein [Flavobacterium sp. UBA6135]
MIKEYLARISTDLSRFNQTLSKTSILIDKPWALVDDNNEIQKLIFKKNNELILSKNGKAEVGKWEYFPEAKSLLIDRGSDKIFCNEIFIDKGVIILKLDGTKNDFFALANENVVPNLDIISYLNHLFYEGPEPQKKITRKYELENGLEIEIHSDVYLEGLSNKNILVTIDEDNVKNGFYKIKNTETTIVVKDSKIIETTYDKKYITEDGVTIYVLQHHFYSVSKNDYVLINWQLAEDGCYFLNKNKKIYTENGLIKKILARPTIFNYPLGDFREVD